MHDSIEYIATARVRVLCLPSAVGWLAADARPGEQEAVLLDVGAAGAAAALQLLTR